MKYKVCIHPHDHKKERDWQIILKFIDKNFKNVNLERTLELGAGMGNISCYFASQNIIAYAEDINSEYLDKIKKRNPLIFTLKHDINTLLPFPDNYFDLVSCIGTLHYGYIQNSLSILNEILRVSNKYILLDFLSKYAPYKYLEKLYNPNYNPRCYSSRDVDYILNLYNLKIVSSISTKSLPFLNRILPFTGKTVYLILEKIM